MKKNIDIQKQTNLLIIIRYGIDIVGFPILCKLEINLEIIIFDLTLLFVKHMLQVGKGQDHGVDYPHRSLQFVRHGPHITAEDRELTMPRKNGGHTSRERMLQDEEQIKQRRAAMKKKLRSSGDPNLPNSP